MTERRIEELAEKIGNSLTDEVEWKIIEETLRECADEQKAIDKKNAHKAFVELLAVQYGEDCDESMHQYIDDALNKTMEE